MTVAVTCADNQAPAMAAVATAAAVAAAATAAAPASGRGCRKAEQDRWVKMLSVGVQACLFITAVAGWGVLHMGIRWRGPSASCLQTVPPGIRA